MLFITLFHNIGDIEHRKPQARSFGKARSPGIKLDFIFFYNLGKVE